jgi:hypothetical protein
MSKTYGQNRIRVSLTFDPSMNSLGQGMRLWPISCGGCWGRGEDTWDDVGMRERQGVELGECSVVGSAGHKGQC